MIDMDKLNISEVENIHKAINSKLNLCKVTRYIAMNSIVIEKILMINIWEKRPVEIYQLAAGREIPRKKVSASKSLPAAIPEAN